MQIPDYAALRRRAGKERAVEMRRLTALLRRAIRSATRWVRSQWHTAFSTPHGTLKPVPIRNRRWPPPYDIG